MAITPSPILGISILSIPPPRRSCKLGKIAIKCDKHSISPIRLLPRIGLVLFALFTAQIASPREAFAAGSRGTTAQMEDLRARDVKLMVDGTNRFVYDLMHRGMTYGGIPTVSSEFASLELTERSATVEITYIGVPVNFARIRHLNADIAFRKTGNKISFRIDRPGAYVIEVNRDLRNRGPVVIFANKPERWILQPGDIAFRPGTVTDAGVIRVKKDNQRIYIPAGAVVRALLKIEGATGTKISGGGVLLFDDKAAQDFKPEADTSPILATDAKDLTLKDVTVVVAPTSFASGPDGAPDAPWAVHLIRSTNIEIRDLNILNALRDGIDIDGSEHVTVQGGFFQAHDDVLCVKATNYGPGGGGENHRASAILFDGVMAMNTGAGNVLAIGTELHTAEIADVTFRDVDILHALGGHATAVSIRNGDRADVHDILFDDIRVLDRPGTLLKLTVEMDGYRPDPDRGTVSTVIFRNFNVPKFARAASAIEGWDARHTVTDVRFENLRPAEKLEIAVKTAPAPQ